MGRGISSMLSGEAVTVGDMASGDDSQLGALARVWITAAASSLALVVSLIIGATSAARPEVEFRLKRVRVFWMLLLAGLGGLMYTVGSSALGVSRLASSGAVAEHGLGQVERLRSLLDEAGNATDLGESVSLLTDVRGYNDRPVLFLSLLQQASILGQVDAMAPAVGEAGTLVVPESMLTGADRVRVAEARLLQEVGTRDSSSACSTGQQAMEPACSLSALHNRISSSPRLSWCMSYATQAEVSAAMYAVELLEAIPAASRADVLPLRIPANGSSPFSWPSNRSTPNEPDRFGGGSTPIFSLPTDPDSLGTLGLFSVSVLVWLPCMALALVLIAMTPSRGMDEAT